MLKNLDPSNAKALFRRAIANKSFGKYEESVRDLQALFKQDQTKKDIKAELDDCMKKLVEVQQAKKEKADREATKPQAKAQKIVELTDNISTLK